MLAAARASSDISPQARAGFLAAELEQLTGLDNEFEKIAEEQVLKGELFFDMEKALRSAGGVVSVTDKNFASNVVVDRELITGQNPASDQAMADALIEALDRAAA